jgi:hypothetical protein
MEGGSETLSRTSTDKEPTSLAQVIPPVWIRYSKI